MTMARYGNTWPEGAIGRFSKFYGITGWLTASSPQKNVRRILDTDIRLPPGAAGHAICDEQVALHDENLLVADPTDQRRMRQKRDAPWHILIALDLDSWQVRQSLANALRFFRVGLSLLGELNWLVGLGSGDDGQRHRAEIG